MSLGKLFGQKLEKKALTTVAMQLLAMSAGPLVAKGLLGLVPALGQAVNAGVAFTITEGIGWGAYVIFANGEDITKLSKTEFKERIKKGKKLDKPDPKALISRMTAEDRESYQALEQKIKQKNISDEEYQSIMDEMGQIVTKYST